MTAERKLGIKIPADDIIASPHQIMVLIGVSGCGKTRTCYEYAKKRTSLYFDCHSDADMKWLCSTLTMIMPAQKEQSLQAVFEAMSRKLIKAMLMARMYVLSFVLGDRANFDEGSAYDQEKVFTRTRWLYCQRSFTTLSLFEMLAKAIASFDDNVFDELFDMLKKKYKDMTFIFDEANGLLSVCEKGYHGLGTGQNSIKGGSFVDHRSFLTFISRSCYEMDLRSIWSGTSMRIKSMSLFQSACCGKINLHLVSEFTYLTEDHVGTLLRGWLDLDEIQKQMGSLENMNALIKKISFLLQGRPRIFFSFIQKVSLNSDKNLDELFREYVVSMTTDVQGVDVSSFYYFWKARIQWSMVSFFEEQRAAWKKPKTVADLLVQICLESILGQDKVHGFNDERDMVSTQLVMAYRELGEWKCRMREPLPILAGRNFMLATRPDFMVEYFTEKLLEVHTPLYPSLSERGNLMELVVTARFFQRWWMEDKARAILPDWVNQLTINAPTHLVDCRTTSKKLSMDMVERQTRDSSASFVMLMPQQAAAADVCYSSFSCHVKTMWSGSGETRRVSSTQCLKNRDTVPMTRPLGDDERVSSAKKAKHSLDHDSVSDSFELDVLNKAQVSEELAAQTYHIIIEWPRPAKKLDQNHKVFETERYGPLVNGVNRKVMLVNMDNPDVAAAFFGETFMKAWRRYASIVQVEPTVETMASGTSDLTVLGQDKDE